MSEWRLIGIMRHGEAFRLGMDPQKKGANGSLTTEGLRGAYGVGERLADSLRELDIGLPELSVVCADSPEARSTADAVVRQMTGAASPVPLESLDPYNWTVRSTDDAATRWQKIFDELQKRKMRTDSVIVVGHDPQTSWLLHYKIEEHSLRQRFAGPLPLARGELAVLVHPDASNKAVLWMLSPTDEKRLEELQAKIKSKMESAKLLGAFVTALLVFAGKELTGVSHPPGWYMWVAGLGIALLALSTGAYFVTMFRYDELLMPVGFWPSPRRPNTRAPRGFVRRPPSSASWILYQNMMRIWATAFLPATFLAGLGTVVVTVALTRPHDLWWLVVALAIPAAVAIVWLIWRIAKPDLGVSD